MLAGLGFMFARPALGRSWPALPARNAPLATSCRQRLMAARFSPKGKCRLPHRRSRDAAGGLAIIYR